MFSYVQVYASNAEYPFKYQFGQWYARKGDQDTKEAFNLRYVNFILFVDKKD